MSGVIAPLDLALAYAARGWPVFPCASGDKSPLTLHGFKDATATATTIRMWWRRWPDAMIAIPTGSRSGVWVLDMDLEADEAGEVVKDGVSVVSGLGPSLPDTPVCATPRGGRHAFFKWDQARPVKNSTSRLGLGVDTRGEGGYVILAGSVRADGAAYSWELSPQDCAPAEAPEWLYAALDKAVAPVAAPAAPPALRVVSAVPDAGAERYAQRALEEECRGVATAPQGTRNDALNRAAFNLGQLVAGGALSETVVRNALERAALDAGLVGHEVRATINSGLASGYQKPRAGPDRSQLGQVVELNAGRAVAAGGNLAVAEFSPDGSPSFRFPVTAYADIPVVHTKRWLIKGVLGAVESTVIYGAPSSGKSIIAVDMACHLGAGLEWFGHKIKQPHGVLIVAAERAAVTKKRIAGWRQRHGLADLPVYVTEGLFDLWSRRADAEELARIALHYGCAWVIVDTKQQVMAGGDVNSDRDVGGLIGNVALLQQQAGVHVTIVDHIPMSAPDRMKGSGALGGAVDGSLLVLKEGQTHLVRWGSKSPNDTGTPLDLAFELDDEVLGVDEDGDETTSPIVMPLAASERPDPNSRPPTSRSSGRVKKKLSAGAQKVMAAYGRLVDDGQAHKPPHVPGVRADDQAVTLNDLRLKAFEIGLGGMEPTISGDDLKSELDDKKDWATNRRKVWQRAMDQLEQEGILRTEQGFAWPLGGNLSGVFDNE